ncbi:4-hydroxy-tetrahydrodipicolinate reductase [Nonlabens xiamenensis]|uniref:4-hydroxy-tetrahydrodipicolinate reductase n=1 Tax=Nonlabens xiamenensis TaxID=2341043 RepID=UPI000F60463E|nr:4-hydroxy-tetrahydrodipicolinate reductase [Nonlabens xiamenensis]
MKIALLGYGKMGKAIENVALERGHTVVTKVGRNDSMEDISKADVIIEFTSPDSVINNLKHLIPLQIPVVCGTTGWNDSLEEIEELVQQHKSALVHASNFSLGVNLFFELNRQLAEVMSKFEEQYEVSLQEIHHTQKKDAPSGTALSLFEGLHNFAGNKSWHLGTQQKPDSVPIEAIREDDVKGTHTVTYKSGIDSIHITHEAYTREGFAMGAVIAAEWINNKKGMYTMKDVLGL